MEKKTMMVCIENIKWDTDDIDEMDKEGIDLPSKINLILDYTEDDDVEEAISDWLSNEFGFCHFGFNYKVVEE